MAGFSSLSGSSIAETIVPTVVAATSGVVAYLVLTSLYRKVISKGNPDVINKSIEKETAKIAHSFDIEDLPDKVAYCRCWRSKKVRKQDLVFQPLAHLEILLQLVKCAHKIISSEGCPMYITKYGCMHMYHDILL